jgi:hypothetical protein
MRKGHMGNHAVSKERRCAIFCPVEKLVGHEKFPRPQVLFQ